MKRGLQGDRLSQKRKGEALNYSASPCQNALPSLVQRLEKAISLELEFNTQPQRRRELEDRSRAIERICELNKARSRDTAVNSECLIQSDGPLVIEHVEPISLETQFSFLSNLDWIVSVHVQIEGGRRAVGTNAVHLIGK